MRGWYRAEWLALALVASSLGLVSCGEEIVQTAERVPETLAGTGGGAAAALDCLGAVPSDDLPAGAAFGEGDAADSWPLVAASYGPLEGPGLYLVARDTFRVYVNGHLVGQSASARTPIFLPLSLLPGENVIAVAVHAGAGTPAALIHLAELTRDYVSSSDWKLSASPEGDWKLPGYDDSSWDSARELGAIGGLPGCDSELSFPASTEARWIGPDAGTEGPVALRMTIRVAPIGFGEGTTGGAVAAPQIVSSWEALEALATSDTPATILLAEGVHDLRRQGAEIESVDVCPTSCPEEPGKTVYQVLPSGTCAVALEAAQRDDRGLHLGSNKTILGLGRGAAVRGVSFDLGASQNVIIRNIAVFDVNRNLLEAGDAFTLEGAMRVWLDHVTLKWVSDAFADLLAGTEQVTISHALFDGGTEGECNGRERWAMSMTDAQVTIHHSRFDQVSAHAPHAEGSMARVHLFNNVHSNSADWTVGSGCLAEVLLEGSVFENVEVVSRLSTCNDTADRGLMNAVAGSNLYRDGTVSFIGGDGTEPHDAVFIPEYDYEAEPAADAWPRVILRAGAGGPWALPVSVD
jgi:pectate lyase